MADIAERTPATTQAAHPEADPRRWIALGVVLTASFMVLLDISIVNVAIPSIQRNLNATFGQIQLVLAGYQLAYAVVLITGGRLGDIAGRKRLFMIGMTGFTIASALCGSAQNADMLVVSRVLQGLMASLMYPQVLSVIQVVFPPRERAAAFGIFGAVIGLATIAGPLIGGLLIGSDVAGGRWRLIFLVNVPVGIASLIAAAVLLHESRAPHARRLDIPGVAVVSVGLFLLTYPLVEGRDRGWPAWAFVMLVAAAPALAAFIAYERRRGRRGASPLVEMGMFGDRAFTAGNVLSLLFFTAIPSFFLIFSITLQIGLGFSALRAGVTTVPYAVGAFIASAASVRLAPMLGKRILQVGAVLLVAGTAGVVLTMSARGTALDGPELLPSLLVCGLGLGCVVAPLINVILAGIHQGDAGSASGVLTTVQQIGGAVGVAVVGVIFFGLLGSRADTVSTDVAPQLRQQLTAAHLTPVQVDGAVVKFTRCFHDRANESDPSVVPPSCPTLDPAANDPVTVAFRQAGTEALGRNFAGALERSLGYHVAVFAVSFLLIFGLPRAGRHSGMRGGAGAGH